MKKQIDVDTNMQEILNQHVNFQIKQFEDWFGFSNVCVNKMEADMLITNKSGITFISIHNLKGDIKINDPEHKVTIQVGNWDKKKDK